MRTQPIASLFLLAAILVPACSDDGETCANGDCSSGPGGSGSGPTTTTTTSSSSSTGQGGSGGGGEPLNTEIVFTDFVTGEPLAGETVVVNAADGSVVSQTETGADGSVPVEIPAGGSVSVFYSYSLWVQDMEYPIRNTQTVYPGDAQPTRIALQDGGFYEPEPGSGYMVVGVTWDTVPGAGQYIAKTNCFSQEVAAPGLAAASEMTDCTNDGLYDVVIAAYDGLGVLDRYALLLDQPFMDQGKLNHDVSWGNGGQLGDIPYTVTNLSDDTLDVEVRSVATRQTHGVPISLEQKVLHDLPDGPEVSGSVKHAVGFGNDHCSNIIVRLPGLTAVSYSRCGSTPSLLPITFDASRLARFSFSGPTTATSASWVDGMRGELGDVLSVTLVEYADGGAADIRWTAFVAPGAGSVTRPEIPAGLEDYTLPGVDSASVVNRDIRNVTGFAAALEVGPVSLNAEASSNSN